MKNPIALLLIALTTVASSGRSSRADVTLPAILGNHMVLQRDQAIPLWGQGAPGESITVSFAGFTVTTRAGQDGRWQATLPKQPATADPRVMVVEGSGGSRVELSDILVGEVWFCTGPSNIFWPVRKCDHATEEIREASHPEIRFFTCERGTADEPQTDCIGSWCVCSPESVADVSGVGYFFSRQIHGELGVPVGLLQSYWGGSRIEAWTSREALESQPRLRPVLDWWQQERRRYQPAEAEALHAQQLAAWNEDVRRAKADGTASPKRPAAPLDPHTSPHRPACLYNTMVAPLIPFSIRGVICYQGLGNLFWAEHSAGLLETMIGDWRARWGQGDFPVGMIQPAPYDPGSWARSSADAYSVQRESQLLVQQRVANTGIALTMDVDAVDVLHFPGKQLVAERLAAWALDSVYGRKTPWAGPVFQSMAVEGESVRVRFRNAGPGLKTSDARPPVHFEVAGSDGRYFPASAAIDGPDVLVRSDRVPRPIAVRFAFSDTAVVNLVNAEGLPASLFRTGESPRPDVRHDGR
ncbi:MAG: hypothetical protein ACYC6Y_17485 [Thermoguttaceae bacterium]